MKTSLTQEEKDLMPVIRDKWIGLFHSGMEIDKERARKDQEWLYELARKEKPLVLFVDSPMACQVAANAIFISIAVLESSLGIKSRGFTDSAVRSAVRSAVGSAVRSAVRSAVGSAVGSAVDSAVDSAVRSAIDSAVDFAVHSAVHSAVRSAIELAVGSAVGSAKLPIKVFPMSWRGSYWDYYWSAYIDYYQQIGVLPRDNENYNRFRDIVKSGIYTSIQLDGLVICCGLPVTIKKNERGQLHCEDGCAIEFRDGYKQWYWKGGNVPQKLIESPETITAEDLKIDNAETRRAFIEVLGVQKYFNILSGGDGLKTIDEDMDGQGYPMKLMQFDFEGKNIQVLEVTCPSTERIYNLYPPNQQSKNVWEAKASTFNSEKLFVRHGDVGLVDMNNQFDKPLIET